MSECEHENFKADVKVGRLTSDGPMKFTADVRINCADCRKRFIFLGLPGGFYVDGPAVSFDGFEARLAIKPDPEEFN